MALGLMTTIAACGGGGEKADNSDTADGKVKKWQQTEKLQKVKCHKKAENL